MDRFEAELILQDLTGGDAPDIDEGMVYSAGGWTFSAITASSGDTYNITSAISFITNHNWGVVETVATQKIYFYWFDVTAIDDLASIKVTYDDGGGEFVYTYDLATAERVILQESGAALYMENAQASFTILIQAYDAITGGGNLLDAVTLITGPAARSGIGTSAKASDDEIITGNALEVIAAFDIFTAEDSEAPPVEIGEPILGLRATYDAGNQTGTWAPDYENGATQKATLTANLQVDAVTNMPDGATMNLYFTLATFELTFAAADYEGSALSFTTQDFVAASVINFNEAKLAVGAMGY